MRVVFMGTPGFAVPSLEQLVQEQYQVVAVYTRPDRVAGRGRSLAASPVKTTALSHNLTLIQPRNFKEPETVSQLAGFHPDAIVVVAYGQILPQSVLDIPAYGCINIHPSLLPKFRGAAPIPAAILAGSEFTGVSIMLMDAGMDTGPVLARVQVPILPQDTTGLLTSKLSLIASNLLLEVLPRRIRGEITPQPQNNDEATYTKVLSKKEGEIDWRLPAIDLWRRVRAFYPWPGCYTWWQGKQLKIIEVVPMPSEKTLEAGKVVALDQKEAVFGINTGDGILGIVRIQMEGKRIISSAEFMRGQRQFVSAILPSN